MINQFLNKTIAILTGNNVNDYINNLLKTNIYFEKLVAEKNHKLKDLENKIVELSKITDKRDNLLTQLTASESNNKTLNLKLDDLKFEKIGMQKENQNQVVKYNNLLDIKNRDTAKSTKEYNKLTTESDQQKTYIISLNNALLGSKKR